MNKLIPIFLSILVPAIAQAKTQTLTADTTASTIQWEGHKLAGSHHGSLNLKSGSLKLDNNTLVGGEFAIDMTSLKDEDLTDKEYNTKLVNHLRSDDFFSVEKHPTANFIVKKVDVKTPGEYMVTGDLTIKGIKNSISFPVQTTSKDGKFTAKAKMELDRTKWDIKFRSSKFFADVGDKVIYDNFGVNLVLVANAVVAKK